MKKILNTNTDFYYKEGTIGYVLFNKNDDDYIIVDKMAKGLSLSPADNIADVIEYDKAIADGYKVIRRTCAGGTGYFDEGTVMFTLVKRKYTDILVAMRQYYDLLVNYFKTIVDTTIHNIQQVNNDIFIDDKKVAGTSVLNLGATGALMLSTVISFNANQTKLAELIKVNVQKCEEKNLPKVHRTGNIFDYSGVRNMDDMVNGLYNSVEATEYTLSNFENSLINLSMANYKDDEWILNGVSK